MESRVYEFDIAAEAREHDRRQKLLRVLFAAIAAPLWLLSYWVVLALVSMPVTLFGGGRRTVLAITAVMMLLLAWEGFRYGKQLFDAERFARSFFGGLSTSEEGRNLSSAVLYHHGIPNPFSLGFVISQLLFCAPRSQ